MTIRLICFVLGTIIGGMFRWETPDDSLSVGDMSSNRPATTFLAVVPDLGKTPPAPPMTEVFEAEESEFLENLVLRVAVSAPPDLRTLLITLKEQNKLSTLAKDVIFLRWMEIDPAGGLREARSAGELRCAYWSWAKIDPDEAMFAAVEEDGSTALEAVLRAIGQSDPEEALKIVGTLSDPRDGRLWGGILDGLGDEDPQRAVEESVRQGYSGQKYIRAWIRRDPEVAFAWLVEHRGHDENGFAYAMEQLFQFHPGMAPGLLSTLPEGHPRNLAIIAYASHLSHENPDAALALLTREPPGVRDHALGQIAGNLVHSNPETALKILAQVDWVNPPPNINGSAVQGPNGHSISGVDASESPVDALARMVESGNENAIEFLGMLPPGERSGRAYETIVRQWLERDSMGAGSWIDEQPPGPLKDSAISSMTGWLIYEDPPDFDSAARWALEIQEPEAMNSRLQNIFSRWQNHAPTEMYSALRLPGIPESIIEQFQAGATQTQR